MEIQDRKTALLLSGQCHHFKNTHSRMIDELSKDFGQIDVMSVTWSDRFDTIDTRFNNDVEYLRSVIIPECESHCEFTKLNSKCHLLISNNELLDEFKRMQRNFDVTLNLMQFIKYFAAPFLVAKSFQLFRDYTKEHNIKYDYVCRSRFDVLMQDSVFDLVSSDLNQQKVRTIYSKNVEETHADQDTYFGSHDTFIHLSKNYMKMHRLNMHQLFEYILTNPDARDINLYPESLFLKTMISMNIDVKQKYPYMHTGIYRKDLDKFSHVKEIRRRNLRENNTPQNFN